MVRRVCPLFACKNTYAAGMCRNRKYQVKLSKRLLVFHGFRTGDIFLINSQKSRTMQDRVKRCPFLEEDVDKLISDEARGCFEVKCLGLHHSIRV